MYRDNLIDLGHILKHFDIVTIEANGAKFDSLDELFAASTVKPIYEMDVRGRIKSDEFNRGSFILRIGKRRIDVEARCVYAAQFRAYHEAIKILKEQSPWNVFSYTVADLWLFLLCMIFCAAVTRFFHSPFSQINAFTWTLAAWIWAANYISFHSNRRIYLKRDRNYDTFYQKNHELVITVVGGLLVAAILFIISQSWNRWFSAAQPPLVSLPEKVIAPSKP